MKARLCALVVCAAVIAVIAQSVDGKWAGEVQGGVRVDVPEGVADMLEQVGRI
jgi:hypothetical protein